jgi:uncharacterized membrane protein YedE/YeeE
MKQLTALLAGLLFGAGLLVSGMANPQVVLGFLDVAGHWNPALAFTMGGAIAVAAPAFWWARRSGPTAALAPAPGLRIDARLLAGSALFGIGWGLSGICPGPGLLLLASWTLPAWAFVAAMALGMLLPGWLERRAG